MYHHVWLICQPFTVKVIVCCFTGEDNCSVGHHCAIILQYITIVRVYVGKRVHRCRVILVPLPFSLGKHSGNGIVEYPSDYRNIMRAGFSENISVHYGFSFQPAKLVNLFISAVQSP